MLKTFIQLLGEDAAAFRRYLLMALGLGLLSALTLGTLVPVLDALLARDLAAASRWLALLLLGALACWVWRRQVERAGIRVGVAVLRGARQRLGEHLAGLPVGWFTPENSARLGHVLTQGLMSVAQLPAHVFTPVIGAVVAPPVLALLLCGLQGRLGLVALALLPGLAVIFVLAAALSRRADEAFQQDFAQASQRMLEFAQAQSTLRAFNGEGGGSRFLERAIAQQRRSGARMIWHSALASVLNSWAAQGGFALLLVLAVLSLLQQVPSQGAGGEGGAGLMAAVLALVLLSRFADPLLELAAYADVLRGARAQLAAIQLLFEARPLPEPAEPQVPRDASVTLCGLHFRYAPGEAEVLHGLDLHVPAGSMTALVGASGSGKSTVMRLIARFHEASQGAVHLGGVDVRALSTARLNEQIAQIFQDSYLFSGSVGDNIRLGRPGASEAELHEVAEQAGLAEMLASLPLGLDTPVGEGGARLSGGERQRIAIARALIKDAPILLVDEATAALDTENQALIARTLARLRGRCTLIVIAHQLSTVAMADQIVVLEQGRIVEQGAPAVLRERGGPYALFLAQRRASQGWRVAA